MFKTLWICVFFLISSVSIYSCSNEDGSLQEPLLIFAAASLSEALNDVGASFVERGGSPVQFNFAGSNVLAQQILKSEKGDIFISASEHWMNEVQLHQKIIAASRRPFLSNSLVIIANNKSSFLINKQTDLCRLNPDYLSIGNPDAVPAGIYAKEWMLRQPCSTKNLWDYYEPKISPAMDVKSALNLVEAGPSIIGIVYKTDVSVSKKVKILYDVPSAGGPKIQYSIAQIINKRMNLDAEKFLIYLKSPAADSIFDKYGFLPIH